MRCSIAARLAGDLPVGTAPPARQWFLVEHPGPWGRLGYAGSGLDPAVVTALSSWADATGGRVVLVRRPGRAGPTQPEPERRWFRVDSRPGHEAVRTGTVADLRDLPVDPDADAGTPEPGPLVLVCTHGRHDTCCAVEGRPVAAALARADPDAVWECSHIGGCRFAPAVVLLPHGFVLAAQDPASAAEALARYRDGRVEERLLRGRSSLPPAVQAAQHAARVRLAVDGVDALRPVDAHGEDGRWTVRLADPDCVVRLVERHVDAGRPLTCAATAPGRLRIFDTLSVTVG